MTPELPNSMQVPFVVAATGHRDLRSQDLDPLRNEIRNVLADMCARMPNTPLVLITGLAEGADQLVAEVALEQHVYLAAVLPMPLDVYRTTMSVDAQKKLDELLTLCSVKITLPLEGQPPAEITTSEVARARCYEALARFLASHGQAMIALWDGNDAQKMGGTSSVIQHIRNGILKDEAESRCGMVYHVVTPRASGKGPAETVRTILLGRDWHSLMAADQTPAQRRATLQNSAITRIEINMERFNRDAVKLAATTVSAMSHLLVDDRIKLSPFQKRLDSLYGMADAISLRANKWRKLFLASILVIAIVGTLFYGIHGEILEAHIWLWLSFPLFVIAAWVLHRAALASHVEDKYLDARALAEALRVQFFWEMVGIKQSVDRYYLMDQRTELDWIRYALKNIWLLHQGTSNDSPLQPNYKAALDYWVKHQENWYRVKSDQQSSRVLRRRKVSFYSLLAAVVWSILVPASILIHGPWQQLSPWRTLLPGNWIYRSFHIALAVPALLAAAYRLWIEQAGYEEQSREYRYMERQFAVKAKELSEHIQTPAVAEKLLLLLGMEAIKENGRWLLLHRERPLEVLSSP